MCCSLMQGSHGSTIVHQMEAALYSYIHITWTNFMTILALHINSTHFCQAHPSRMLIVIYIWQIQNAHVCPPNSTLMNQTELQIIVENIFHLLNQEDPLMQVTFLTHTMTDLIMPKTTKEIKKWIWHSYHHIQAHQESEIKCAQLNSNDIWTYFQLWTHHLPPQTECKNLLQPP